MEIILSPICSSFAGNLSKHYGYAIRMRCSQNGNLRRRASARLSAVEKLTKLVDFSKKNGICLHMSFFLCNFALAYVKARVSRYLVAPKTLRLTLRSPHSKQPWLDLLWGPQL